MHILQCILYYTELSPTSAAVITASLLTVDKTTACPHVEAKVRYLACHIAAMYSNRSFTTLSMMCSIPRSNTIAVAMTLLAKVRHLTSNPLERIDFAEEILHFGLPYGCLGFISNICTFYAAFMLFRGHSPLLFLRDQAADGTRLKYWHLNTALAVTQGLSTITISIIVMARSHHWQLTLIAFSKLAISFILGAVAIRAGLQGSARKSRNECCRLGHLEPTPVTFWLPGLFVTTIISMTGTVGLASKVIHHSHEIQAITAVYGGIGVLLLSGGVLYHWDRPHWEGDGDAHWTTGVVGYQYFGASGFPWIKTLCIIWGLWTVLMQFYSDWVVGLAAVNVLGQFKAGSTILSWLYVGFQLLPLFSC